jgi:tetrahydromethanopterin S-methyltransferase subunit B
MMIRVASLASPSSPRSTAAAASRWLLVTAAAFVAAFYGFAFGLRIGSLFMGVVMAVNAGAMAALLVDGALDGARHLTRRWRGRASA